MALALSLAGSTRNTRMPAGMMAFSPACQAAKSGLSASVLTSTLSHRLSCPSDSGQVKVI